MKERMPAMAAALVPRELQSWGLTAIALGALEGGLLGVIVKNQFEPVASAPVINLAVAVVASAPNFTNLASFLFASYATGRDKRLLLSRLMDLMAASLLLMALVPLDAVGLAAFCFLTIVARTGWSGILTIRATVWRANYPREWRARVTAQLVQISSLLIAACSAAIGFLMDWTAGAFRPAFVVAALFSLVAARIYRRSRIRRHRRLLAAEREEHAQRGRTGMQRLLNVLRDDLDFRHYMKSMMVIRAGNLMVIPMLVVVLNEQLALDQLDQVLVTSSLPLLVLCFSIRHWARLLDRHHIFGYRAIQSWTFVASDFVFAVAVIAGEPALLWPASVLLGAAYAGGHLGWNLGHNDFSSDASATQYMAIHVTLTGMRGVVMPFIGIGFYQILVSHLPAYASFSLLLPLSLSLVGALSFVHLHRARMRRLAAGSAAGTRDR